MNILLSSLFILLGSYAFYKISTKQIKKTSIPNSFLGKYLKIIHFSGLILLLIAAFIFIQKDGFSIGFVSFWIFSTPLIFIFISMSRKLSINKWSILCLLHF